MIGGKKKTDLTMEAILHRISAYDIYRFYMPTKDWSLNEVTHSPFCKDENPSFVIGNKYGNITHIAFNDTSKRGDCFNFVKQLFNLSTLDEVLRKIDTDFQLGLSGGVKGDYKAITGNYEQPQTVKRNSFIQVITRKFTNEELAYWNQYHQSLDDLRANNIYSIKDLFFNRSKFPLKDTELRFGYFYDGYWKIYRPFASKKDKWMPNNVPITVMDGKKDIMGCDTAFINKSKKDYMVVKKIFPCSCAVQNEGIACFSEENVKYLKDNSKTQILSFDADIVGVQNSQQITKMFDFGYCNVPRKYLAEGIKDWADLSKTYSLKAVEEALKQKHLI